MRRLQSLTNVDKRGRPRETTSEIVQAIRTVKGGGILRNIPYPSKMNGLKCVVALVVLSCVVLHSVEGFTSAYGHSIRLNNKAKPDPQRQRRLTTVQSYISQIKRQENNEENDYDFCTKALHFCQRREEFKKRSQERI